jgi:hypothetical protein
MVVHAFDADIAGGTVLHFFAFAFDDFALFAEKASKES